MGESGRQFWRMPLGELVQDEDPAVHANTDDSVILSLAPLLRRAWRTVPERPRLTAWVLQREKEIESSKAQADDGQKESSLSAGVGEPENTASSGAASKGVTGSGKPPSNNAAAVGAPPHVKLEPTEPTPEVHA